jgi:hypothetical protein
MNFIKIILIAIAVVLAAFGALVFVGMAINLLKILFWLLVICIFVALLWKMFGPGDGLQRSSGDEQDKLQSAELTLEEYKRKFESQTRRDAENRS